MCFVVFGGSSVAVMQPPLSLHRTCHCMTPVIAYRDCTQPIRQGEPTIQLSLRCGSRTVHVRDDKGGE